MAVSTIKAITDKFVTDTVNGSLTLSASSIDAISVSATKTGYSPIGIIGINVSGTTVFALHGFYISSGNAVAYFQNTYSESRTGSITFTILYQKS